MSESEDENEVHGKNVNVNVVNDGEEGDEGDAGVQADAAGADSDGTDVASSVQAGQRDPRDQQVPVAEAETRPPAPPEAAAAAGKVASTGASKKESVEYLKKLLSLAKGQIAELKRRRVASDAALQHKERAAEELQARNSKVVALAKRAQKRIETLEARLEEAAPKQTEEEDSSAVPVGVLVRVKQGDDDRKVWCLARLASGQTEWVSEEEVYARVGEEALGFELPPLCLSADSCSKALEREAALAAALDASEDKFRKYRMRMEVMRKQKEAEVERLSANNLRYKQHNITSQDYHAQLDFSRKELERLSLSHGDVEKKCNALQRSNAQLQSKAGDLEHELAAARRGAPLAPLSPGLDGEGNGDDGGKFARLLARTNSQNAHLLEQYAKLEREYDNHRMHTFQALEEHQANIKDLQEQLRLVRGSHAGAGEGDGSASSRGRVDAVNGGAAPKTTAAYEENGDDDGNDDGNDDDDDEDAKTTRAATERAYIKNILLQYMGSGASDKHVIEAALATALQFTPEEVALVQKRKAAAAAASSGAPFSLFSFGSSSPRK